MSRAGLLTLTLLLVPLLGGVAEGGGETSRYIVGYKPGDDAAAQLAIQAAGGSVKRTSPELGFAVVETSRSDFASVVRLSPSVQYVERDDPIRLNGVQWNGVQWNGVQWNGVQWNGVQWNGVQWNGVQWNGATGDGVQWNSAQWSAAHWSVKLFNAASGTKWRYDTATTDPGLVWQWGAWATRTPDAWTVSTGTRTASLCVLDSGVAWEHPDLAANVWTGPRGERGHNAMDPLAAPVDDAGHGTHMAGVAAAVVNNAFGVAGAGNVRILPVKVLGAEGSGHESDLAFGLAWCAGQRASVALMALSVTGDEPTRPTLDRALGYASAADVLLVASAGNAGPCADCVAYPASDPRVVAVGALDGNLTHAPFSSRGPQVELAAPGVHVLGTFPGGAFAFGSGTSQAAAFAAGIAAMVRDVAPHLGAQQARDVLRATARDLGPTGPDPAFGHGLVRADAALARAAAAPAGAS